MGYKSDLKNQRAVLIGKKAALEEYDKLHALSASEDRELADVRYELRDVETKIAQLDDDRGDYRGISGRKIHRTADDEQFTTYLRGKSAAPEFRAILDANGMSTAPNSGGISAGPTGYDAGYLIPQGFWQQLTIALKAYGGVSSAFRPVITPTGNPMPWPTVDPTGIVGKYLTELQQLGFGGDANGTDYQFGQGMLNAWTIVSGVILASVQLIEDAAFDVDAFVADRIGEAIGRKLAAEVISGTGANACLGIIPALDARGSAGTVGGAITPTGGFVTLNAGQTVKTFASTAPTELAGNLLSPQTLIAMLSAVDPAYYPNAAWYMSPTQAWNLRSVVDSNGRPLLSFLNGMDADSVRGADYTTSVPVASLFGFPVICDANIPALTASTAGGPIFGDLSKAMVLRMVRNDARVDITHPVVPTTMRLTERYADYLQVGYLGYLRVDSRSNDVRAAVTVRCAAT